MVAENINVNYDKINDTRLKNFYYKSHYEECINKITDEEYVQIATVYDKCVN